MSRLLQHETAFQDAMGDAALDGSAPAGCSPAVDTSVIRAIVAEMRSQYGIALDHAYCPSSAPYVAAMAGVEDLNTAFLAVMDSIEKRQGNNQPVP